MTSGNKCQDICADFSFRQCLACFRISRLEQKRQDIARSISRVFADTLAARRNNCIDRRFEETQHRPEIPTPWPRHGLRYAQHIEWIDPSDGLEILFHCQADILGGATKAVGK